MPIEIAKRQHSSDRLMQGYGTGLITNGQEERFFSKLRGFGPAVLAGVVCVSK